MSLEERVASVRKELEVLEERLKEEAHYKPMYEELKSETEAALSKAEADATELKSKVEALGADVDTLTHLNLELTEKVNQLGAEKEAAEKRLSEANASRQGFKDFLRPVIRELYEEEKLVTELVKEPAEGAEVQPVEVPRVFGDYTVRVRRAPIEVSAETALGKIAVLISEGFFSRGAMSISKIGQAQEMKHDPLPETEIRKAVEQLVRESVLSHVVLHRTHCYKLRADAKDRVHVVYEEAKA